MDLKPVSKKVGWRTLLLLSGWLWLSACVSIKPSTVALSAEVGSRLSEMEKIHLIALQRYFDLEQKRVEDFLSQEWEPLFLKNFLGRSRILSLLQNPSSLNQSNQLILTETIRLYLSDTSEASRAATELVKTLSNQRKGEEAVLRSVLGRFVEDSQLPQAVSHVSSVLGSEDPAQLMIEFAQAAHQQMLERRQEMLAPLQEARQEAMASLSAAYAELIRGQATITGRLEAAARRSKQQDELLEKLGVKPISEEAAQKMSSISEKVTKALSQAKELIDQKDGKVLDKIKKIFSF